MKAEPFPDSARINPKNLGNLIEAVVDTTLSIYERVEIQKCTGGPVMPRDCLPLGAMKDAFELAGLHLHQSLDAILHTCRE
jgi:hypothetical protein